MPAEVRGGTKSPGTGVKDGSCELSLGPLKEQSPVFFKLVMLVIRIQILSTAGRYSIVKLNPQLDII